jgi:hypothetical protein
MDGGEGGSFKRHWDAMETRVHERRNCASDVSERRRDIGTGVRIEKMRRIQTVVRVVEMRGESTPREEGWTIGVGREAEEYRKRCSSELAGE